MKLNTNIRLDRLLRLPEKQLTKRLDSYKKLLHLAPPLTRSALSKLKFPIPPSMRRKMMQNLQKEIDHARYILDLLEREVIDHEEDESRMEEYRQKVIQYLHLSEHNETFKGMFVFYESQANHYAERISEWNETGRRENRRIHEKIRERLKTELMYLEDFKKGYIRFFDMLLREIGQKT